MQCIDSFNSARHAANGTIVDILHKRLANGAFAQDCTDEVHVYEPYQLYHCFDIPGAGRAQIDPILDVYGTESDADKEYRLMLQHYRGASKALKMNRKMIDDPFGGSARKFHVDYDADD